MAKTLATWLVFVLPGATIILFSSALQEPSIGAVDPHSESYKDGMTLLLSSSQSLVTVALSALAAQGYLMIQHREAARVCLGLLSVVATVTAILSIYFSARIGYWGSYSVAAEVGDIATLTSFFNYQAFAALVEGSALGATALRLWLK